VATVPLKATQPDSVPVFWNVKDVFTAPIPFPVDGMTPTNTKLAPAGTLNPAIANATRPYLIAFIVCASPKTEQVFLLT
jgi:hypothetical protein